MAQTWPPNKWKVSLLRVVDALGRPLARAVASHRRADGAREPRRILVVEPWQIGDVVLVTPLLRALRKCFPRALITLLGKPHAAELLAESGLVDDFIIAELPWARPSRKYSPHAFGRMKIRRLIGALRAASFDLAFDARMDIRSDVLVALSGSRRRVGLRHHGGDWLLTDAVAIDLLATHRVDDWLALLPAVGCGAPAARECLLRTSAEEKAAARRTLEALISGSGPIVAIHPGGSHAGKRWPLEGFRRLAESLVNDGHRVAVFVDPSGYGTEVGAVAGVAVFRPSLRELMALLEQCTLLVCNDSGPMHVAAALGTQTVAIFERGEPRWFGPVGGNHAVLEGKLSGVEVSAAPSTTPPPNPVAFERVRDAVYRHLGSTVQQLY
ncbi:MAG: glycosyltransferase family 9 protein [Gemmatimonadota bacterium]|nr:glycosyltransferase family 9 protein [Gemmatimonadota bacterium]